MKNALVIAILIALLLPQAWGIDSTEKPQLVLISNAIDLELNRGLVDFLKSGFEVVKVSPGDFPKHNGKQRILMLGGPDANDVGGIVGEVLAQPWKDELRQKTGERNVYVESNKWGDNQLVVVVAGHNRYDTQAIATEEKDRILSLLNFKNAFGKITPETVKTKIDSGASFTLLDVRPLYEFDKAHIKNAINIPLAELPTRYTELDKYKEVVTYCQNGKAGAVAAQLLKNFGFERVSNMIDGIDAWKEKFGSLGVEEPTKAVMELKPGVYALKDGNEIDIGEVRISFTYLPGGCSAAQEFIIGFVNLENGKPTGKPSYLVYRTQGQSPPDDITADVHAKGFFLEYKIKTLSWSDVITFKFE